MLRIERLGLALGCSSSITTVGSHRFFSRVASVY